MVEIKTLYVGDAHRVAIKGGADESRPVYKKVAFMRRIKLVGVGGVIGDDDVEFERDDGDVEDVLFDGGVFE